MKQRVDISYMLFLAVTATVGSFLFGYDTAVISGTVELVTARFGPDNLHQGWYMGCVLAGSIAGIRCAGIPSDRMGCRRTMPVSAILLRCRRRAGAEDIGRTLEEIERYWTR